MGIVKQLKIHKTTTLKPTPNEPTKNYFTNVCGDCIDRTNFDAMKKFTKLLIMIFSTILGSLLAPVFGSWYQNQTGIDPIAFYSVSAMGSCAIWIYVLITDLID